jgi:hypothetical protein
MLFEVVGNPACVTLVQHMAAERSDRGNQHLDVVGLGCIPLYDIHPNAMAAAAAFIAQLHEIPWNPAEGEVFK